VAVDAGNESKAQKQADDGDKGVQSHPQAAQALRCASQHWVGRCCQERQGWQRWPRGTPGTGSWFSRSNALGESPAAPDGPCGARPPGVAVELHRTLDWPAARALLEQSFLRVDLHRSSTLTSRALGPPHRSRWQTRTSHRHPWLVAVHDSPADSGRCTCQPPDRSETRSWRRTPGS